MGAVTAIMYGDKDPSIAGMILDSPFSSLKLLVEELVKDKVNLPNWIVNQALKLVKSTVHKKGKFKLDDIEPITFAERCFIPALFVAAKEDNFVKPHHAKLLYDVYPGDKNIVSIDGDHNSARPRFFKDSAAIFFYNTLQVQYIKEISDNYAGFSKKKEEQDEINQKKEEYMKKEEMINNHPHNNIPKSEDVEPNDELFNDLEIEDEEEVFNKILELSKKEFEKDLINQEANKNDDVNNSEKEKDLKNDKDEVEKDK